MVHPKISGLKEETVISQSSMESLDLIVQPSLGVSCGYGQNSAGTGATEGLPG